MDNLIRLLLRFLLVPLGYCAGTIAGTLVIIVAAWQLVSAFFGGHPDGHALAVFGIVVGGPVLLVFVMVMTMLPASVGILISEAFAIRSWIFHVINGVVSAWLGWKFYEAVAGKSLPLDQPLIIVAAGIAAGFAYWGVAGFSAGFYKPVFRQDPPPPPPPALPPPPLAERI